MQPNPSFQKRTVSVPNGHDWLKGIDTSGSCTQICWLLSVIRAITIFRSAVLSAFSYAISLLLSLSLFFLLSIINQSLPRSPLPLGGAWETVCLLHSSYLIACSSPPTTWYCHQLRKGWCLLSTSTQIRYYVKKQNLLFLKIFTNEMTAQTPT